MISDPRKKKAALQARMNPALARKFGGPSDGRRVGSPSGPNPLAGDGGPGWKKQHPIAKVSGASSATAFKGGQGPVANSQNLVAKINFLRQRKQSLAANPVTQKSGVVQSGQKQADKIAFLRQQLAARKRKRAAGPQSGTSSRSK